VGLISTASRIADYYGRHGLKGTLERGAVGLKRSLFAKRMVVFYCDLSTLGPPHVGMAESLRVERATRQADITPGELQEITSLWNPKQALKNIQERFAKNSSLWLLKSNGKLAGYGWTITGQTIEPYYLSLKENDVHLFDFHVFAAYRGKGLNPFLVNHILADLAAQGKRRAFIEAAEWNEAQLSSLRKTPFRRLGWAKKTRILHHTVVSWSQSADTNSPSLS
jgi:ribosomal protein S18 acetylase RimI-like enzyme